MTGTYRELSSQVRMQTNSQFCQCDVTFVYVCVGLEESGVSLLQTYVDRTGDVQTAALIMIHSFPSHMAEDQQVNSWIRQ